MEERIDTQELWEACHKRLAAKRAAGDITIDELLDLSSFYKRGPHEPFVEILEEVLQRDPNHVRGRIWMAWECVFLDWLPGFMERGLKLIDGLIPLGGETAAVGYSLLAAADYSLQEHGPEYRAKMYEKCVALCPEWSSNHKSLALNYAELGRYSDAIVQMQIALDNLLDDFDPYWRPERVLWESGMTGRVVYDFVRREDRELLESWRKQAHRRSFLKRWRKRILGPLFRGDDSCGG